MAWNPLRWLFAGSKKQSPDFAALSRMVQARIDSAQTTNQNKKHWSMADGLSANAAYSPAVRQTLRNRARYEFGSNSYCAGLVRTVANHTVGTGPRLQVISEDQQQASEIEAAFSEWSKKSGLTRKLRELVIGRMIDGEPWALLTSNPAIDHPVKLDLRTFESDQLTGKWTNVFDPYNIDGVQLDEHWNVVSVDALKHHPGDRNFVPTWEYDTYSAESVIRYLRTERAGQVRGVPDLTPALELYAILRRFTLATLSAAEVAALFAAFIKSTTPAATVADNSANEWQTMEIERGTNVVLPEGWDVSQLKPEHPATTYEMFCRAILREIARCLSVPYNIAACDSAGYNYSSGRLDHQMYYKAIEIDQHDLAEIVCDRVFAAWFDEWRLVSGYQGERPNHAWFWDKPASIDEEKDDNAATIRISNGLSSRRAELAARGLDLDQVDADAARSFGITIEDYRQRLANKLLGPAATQPVAPAITASSRGLLPLLAHGKPQLSAITTPTGNATLQAQAGASEVVSVDLDAYDGGPLPVSGFPLPVIVDLSAMEQDASIRLLLDHKHEMGSLVGRVTSVVNDGRSIKATAELATETEHGRHIAGLARAGVPLPVSIGCPVGDVERIPAGQTVEVNGREFAGPVLVARRSYLNEISFVVFPADQTASAVVHAKEGNVMPTFEEFMASLGQTPESIAAMTDEVKAAYSKLYEASKVSASATETEVETETETEQPVKASAKHPLFPNAGGDGSNSANADTVEVQIRRRASAEAHRIDKLQQLQAKYAGVPGVGETVAKAIETGASPDAAELQLLRASRATAPAPGGMRTLNASLQEVALLQAAGIVPQGVSDQIQQQAHEFRRKHGAGLKQLLKAAARQAGHYVDDITRSNWSGVVQAAFSTAEVTGILSNVMNKSLLDGYSHVETGWEKISSTTSVNDFKTHTRYRLIDSGAFEQVTATGELKSGTLSEQSFQISAKTYGMLMAITREDIINDDLGALGDVPKMMGRRAALRMNDIFWAEFLRDHGTLFTTGRGNYFEGAGTALSIASLKTALNLFRRQKDGDGVSPLGVEPKLLVVPPELEATAYEILNSTRVVGTSSAPVPETNIFAGRYNVVVSSYLTNATNWYLMADPRDLSMIEVAFLNGQRQPTIEQSDTTFNTLGIQIRAYFDFGVAQQDYRAAVKSKGAA